MKKHILLLLVFIFLSISLFAQEGIGFGTVLSKDEYSINGSFRIRKGRIMPQPYFINYSWIPEDKYNSDSLNWSMASLANGGLLIIGGIAMMIDRPIKEQSPKRRKLRNAILIPLVAPFYLTNSQTHFILFESDEERNNESLFSIFIHSQTDIYWAREQIWWRFKPGMGVEYSIKLGRKYSLSINAGIIKPYDYLNNQFASQLIRPMFSLKIFESI